MIDYFYIATLIMTSLLTDFLLVLFIVCIIMFIKELTLRISALEEELLAIKNITTNHNIHTGANNRGNRRNRH